MRFDNRILRMRSIFTNVRRAVAQDVYETYGVPDGDHTWLKIIGREGLANPDGETVYLPYGGSIMRYYAKTVIECMDGKAIRVRKHHGAGLLTQTKDSLPPFPGEMNTKAVALLMPVNNLFKACADDDEPEPGEVVVV